MTTNEEKEEEERLAERARRIWGDNPFSPENMAADAALKEVERRASRAEQRYQRMQDMDEG